MQSDVCRHGSVPLRDRWQRARYRLSGTRLWFKCVNVEHPPDHAVAVLYFSEHGGTTSNGMTAFRGCELQGIVAEEPSVPASVSKSSSRSMPSLYRVSAFPSTCNSVSGLRPVSNST